MKRLAVLAAVVAVILTGCTKVSVDLTLNEDQTATGSYVVAVSGDLGDALGPEGDNFFNEVLGRPIDTFDPAIVSVYDEDGYNGYLIQFENRSFRDVMNDIEGLSIEATDREYVVTAPATSTVSDLYVDTFGTSAATLSVTFPGEVLDTNGEVEGTTVAWDLTDADEAPFARGIANDGLTSDEIALVVALFIAFAVGSAISVVIIGRRLR